MGSGPRRLDAEGHGELAFGMLSVIKFSDVTGEPKIKTDLPGPLRIGDPVAMRFRIERENGGRLEQLDVNGRFRVTAVGFEGRYGAAKQLLSVESADKVPTWVSVKKRIQEPRRLGPARHPRQAI